MKTETEQTDLLTAKLLRRGPVRCEECPLAHLAASRVARHIIRQNILPDYVYEPYAEVMGECRDGIALASYPPSRQKICNHPNNSPDTIQSAEEMTDTIIGKLIIAQKP